VLTAEQNCPFGLIYSQITATLLISRNLDRTVGLEAMCVDGTGFAGMALMASERSS
jgi:hypothetical protein